MSKLPEPAIKSYFFGKGYSDLKATILESWRRNMKSASDFAGRAEFDKEWDAYFLGVIYYAAAFSVVVFGTAFFLLASAIHITVLFSFFLLIYITFTLVYLIERLYLFIKGFSTVCRYCHEKRFLPEYHCDNPIKCNNIHRRLIPSSYGTFKHTCTCGQKLPATFFLNRGRLQARCGACTNLLPRESFESRKLFVAIMGGPSVGKSSYLFSVVWKLIEEKLPQIGFSHSFIETRSESDYERVRKNMRQGRPPDKTNEKLPAAFNLMLKKGKSIERLLYLYDPAGEAYVEAENLVLHKFQDYLSGCIFLIDPFSIPYVRQFYDKELAGTIDAIKPGPLPLEDALSRVLLSMEEHYGLSKTERIKFPIAVIINKLDAFDLEKKIGDEAINNHIKSSPTPVDFATARDHILRKQLQNWGQSGFVQRLEERFTKIHYFACSSLGRLPQSDSREFEPCGVLDPLLWIFSEVDRTIVRDDHPSSKFSDLIADYTAKWKRAFIALGILSIIILAFLLWPASPPKTVQDLNVTLTINKTSVQRGEPVHLSAEVLQSGGGALSFDWKASAGSIEGSGSDVELDTSAISTASQPLQVNVSITVVDSKGAKGIAQKSILVQPQLELVTVPPPTDPIAYSADASVPSPDAPANTLSNDTGMPLAQTATLSLMASIDGVQLSVDGISRGMLSRSFRAIRLSPGLHNVKAVKEGYKDWQGLFKLTPDERGKVSIRMEPAGPTPQEQALEQLRRAEQLFQQRQYDAALQACNEGLRLDPSNQALQDKKSNIERAKQILSRSSTSPSSSVERYQRPEPFRQNTEQSSSDLNRQYEPASVIRRVTPVYPSIARSVNVSGKVIVQVTIDESGNVISARALEGPSLLQQAAIDAAKQWKYSSAKRGGNPVRDTKTITFNFTL
jgi:TonB family protein